MIRVNPIIVAVIVALGLFFLFSTMKDKRVNNELLTQNNLVEQLYNSYLEEQKKLSILTIKSIIINKELVNIFKQLEGANAKTTDQLRTKLLQHIVSEQLDTFSLTKLGQLHFHQKNNISFLRVHKTHKYGDNLSNTRETIRLVNEKSEYIEGYEIGKSTGKYRFVYPIKDKDLHLGSVEVNVPLTYFTTMFMNRLDSLAYPFFTIDIIKNKVAIKKQKKDFQKTIFSHYVIHNSFSSLISNIDIEKRFELNAIMDSTKENILQIAKSNKIKSLYSSVNNEIYTVIPMINPISKKHNGFILVAKKDTKIAKIQKDFYTVYSVMLILIMVILVFLYREFHNIEKHREKELIIFEQAKMASLGEMIGNIAHQWRQPLNIISTKATGSIFQKEMGMLSDEQFKDNMESINEHAQYLSKTIDTFKNFIKSSKSKTWAQTSLQHEIDIALTLDNSSFKSHFVNVEKNYCKETINMKLPEGELSQVIINILNNALDVLKQHVDEDHRWIKISLSRKKDIALITIEDSGGGIPKDVLPRIFEPYFTTKHKSQGTGLGLHMSYKIITESMNGNIYAKNTDSGAKFFIELPLNN